jgi:trimethylamine--corrinoid protein Co-methyltransferase
MQAAQETTHALWGAMLSQATLVVHAAGWLEGGLTFGYEKFIADVEALQTLAEMCAPTPLDMGLDALAEVPPGGHFFAAAHTMARYEQAFYPPLLADLSNHGTWAAAGAKEAPERATAIWQSVLAKAQPPAHGAEAADRLAAFVNRRRAEGGAAPLD